MRALLASPLGFLIGLSLGALGGGGSILAVPALVYAAGLGAQDATATSLLLVGLSAGIGMVGHLQAGRVRLGTGLMFGATGVGGSFAGTALNRHLDPDLLLLAFSGLVVVAAWRMATACPTCTKVGEQRSLETPDAAHPTRPSAGRVIGIVAAGTGVGFLTGLFGVGGGFVIVPALTLLLGLSMPQAIGTSLLVIAINSAFGLINRWGTAHFDWKLIAPFLLATIAGVASGSRLADRLDPQKSLNAFAALLIAVAAYTAVRAGLAL